MSSGLNAQLAEYVNLYRNDGIFLDTNVLLLLLFSRIEPAMIGGKRLEKYTLVDAELLSSYVGNFDRILTTSHVLAETSNLAAQVLHGRKKADFFARLSQSFCIEENRDFHQCEMRSLSINEEIFINLGLTDASIVAAMAVKRLLLTDDLDLYLAAIANGAPSINFTHMREVAELI